MNNKRSFFTGDEKIFLKELVVKYKDIIECKKTDSISVSQKKRAWCELTKEFNAISQHCCRNTEQLRKCWENMKNRRKKEIAEDKKEKMATGGGSYQPLVDDPAIYDILNRVDIEIKDTIDSDSIALEGGIESKPETPGDISSAIEEEITIVVAEDTPSTSKIPAKKGTSFTSRGTAIERELEVRLQRNALLQEHEEELHTLRLIEQNLKNEEQQLKVEEQKVRLEIAKYELLLIKGKYDTSIL